MEVAGRHRKEIGGPVYHLHIEAELPYLRMTSPEPHSLYTSVDELPFDVRLNEYELTSKRQVIKVWIETDVELEEHRNPITKGTMAVVISKGFYEYHIWDVYRREK